MMKDGPRMSQGFWLYMEVIGILVVIAIVVIVRRIAIRIVTNNCKSNTNSKNRHNNRKKNKNSNGKLDGFRTCATSRWPIYLAGQLWRTAQPWARRGD